MAEDNGKNNTDESSSQNGREGSSKDHDAMATVENGMSAVNVKDLLEKIVQKPGTTNDGPDITKHKFWATQPVPHFHSESKTDDGPIDAEDPSKVPKQPYPLIDGFEWVTMDLETDSEVEDIYSLLYQNYVEDQEAMFRFRYAPKFLYWALKAPGWRKEWHVGIRATVSRKLVAFISAVPCTMRVRNARVQCAEVNFLCVHKKLRSKRLAPVLIKEITRRCNLVGIWQAIYTAGVLLPTPVSTCRYYHRALDWTKLYEVGFSHLPSNSTKQRQIIRNRVPEQTSIKGLRPMHAKDIDAVVNLLQRYLDTMNMAQVFTKDEAQHWLLNGHETSAADEVVYSYVVESSSGTITDFFSFYNIESTVIGNDKHNSLKVAYLFYYASESAFDPENGPQKAVLGKRLNALVNDALVLAKKASFDVFNALTLLDNPLFLHEQKFAPGDGRLHYYLFNYQTKLIPGGIDPVNHALDQKMMGGVGVVMV